MSSNATPFTTAATRTGAPERCSPELAALAMRRMKDCCVAVEGIDDCVFAFLTGLPTPTVEELVHAWNQGWGYPTVSRLAALKSRIEGRGALPAAHEARTTA
jgi:hypothetical protein